MITVIVVSCILAATAAVAIFGWPVLILVALIAALVMLDRASFHVIFGKKKSAD